MNSVTDRHQWQLKLEDELMALNPDAIEAQELLDSLVASLRERYAYDYPRVAGKLSDVLHYAQRLRDSLDELDSSILREYRDDSDQAYEDQLAREAGL